MPHSANRILNSLPQNILGAVEPHLKNVQLSFADVLAASGQTIDRVYFPTGGIISLVVEMKIGDMIETAMVGRDGIANGMAALDGKVSVHKAIVQVAGAGLAIDPERFRRLCDEFALLRAIIIRHEQFVLAQAQQSAGCNAIHTVEARMCRWLLRIRDLTGRDDMELTQEFLAQMLGVRRTSVSLVAGTLQRAGLIAYRRGQIKLLDIEQLEEGACECVETVRSHYQRLLAV